MSIREAGRIIAAARKRRDTLTPHAAAEEAFHAGGPTKAQIEAQIVAMRRGWKVAA